MFEPTNNRMLLVESETALAELASYRLELLGYRIDTCASGAEGLLEIEREQPRIVIVNTKLVDGDGLEWLARLRAEHSAAELPVLVFSLDPSLETVERAFHAGAQDYLITPFDPTVFEDKIHKLLQAPAAPAKRWALQLF
jgi:DNA-binding response OmpR family regulator